MSCPACLIALSSPEGYTLERSRAYGDEPTESPGMGALSAFVLSAAGAYLILALALPAAGRRLAR